MKALPLLRCALLGAWLSIAACAAVAAEPAKPGTGTGTTAIPLAPPAPPVNCGNQIYLCPSNAQCQALNPVPSGLNALGVSSFEAYRCIFPAQLDMRYPTSCPSGLVLTYLSAQTGGSSVSAATPICAPAPNACPQTNPGWVRVTPVMPLQPPTLGYTCRWGKAR
jgi:hypothetical protein